MPFRDGEVALRERSSTRNAPPVSLCMANCQSRSHGQFESPTTPVLAPPGRRSLAIVVSRCPRRMNRSHMAGKRRAAALRGKPGESPNFRGNRNSPATGPRPDSGVWPHQPASGEFSGKIRRRIFVIELREASAVLRNCDDVDAVVRALVRFFMVGKRRTERPLEQDRSSTCFQALTYNSPPTCDGLLSSSKDTSVCGAVEIIRVARHAL